MLLERGYDSVRQAHFYRPIGGAIGFGERAAAAVAREWLEEFGLRIDQLHLLGVLENLFTYEGRADHEIIFVFGGRLTDAAAARTPRLTTVDPGGQPHEAFWIDLAELEHGEVPVYPEGLLNLLRAKS